MTQVLGPGALPARQGGRFLLCPDLKVPCFCFGPHPSPSCHDGVGKGGPQSVSAPTRVAAVGLAAVAAPHPNCQSPHPKAQLLLKRQVNESDG